MSHLQIHHKPQTSQTTDQLDSKAAGSQVPQLCADFAAPCLVSVSPPNISPPSPVLVMNQVLEKTEITENYKYLPLKN